MLWLVAQTVLLLSTKFVPKYNRCEKITFLADMGLELLRCIRSELRQLVYLESDGVSSYKHSNLTFKGGISLVVNRVLGLFAE